jgi:hypothetical protein
MKFNLSKHNNLMLRSEQRERLEAWAASDSAISLRRYQRQGIRGEISNASLDSAHPSAVSACVMIFTRTQLRATFRRRSFDDDGSRRVRRQR